MREKLIDERLDLTDAICYAMRDWDDYIDECRETETPPIDSIEDFIADGLLSAGYSKQKWIPVEDKQKPKDRKDYFIAYTFGDSDMHFFGVAKYYAYDGNGIVDRPHFSNEGVDGMRVTHWAEIPKLPLPDPPKGE